MRNTLEQKINKTEKQKYKINKKKYIIKVMINNK